jgi:hypothetical protein
MGLIGGLYRAYMGLILLLEVVYQYVRAVFNK